MSQLNLALVLIGAITLLSSLLVGFVRARLYLISEAMLATALGIVTGPAVLDLLRIEAWGGDVLAILEQVARLTLSVAVMSDEHDEQKAQEAVNRLFTFPAFVLFGLALPWADYARIGWGLLLLLAALVLLLRCLTVIYAVNRLLHPLRRRADTNFHGWFGPIGMAAIFYATLGAERAHHHDVWVVGSFIILASIAVHGATSTPFTKWYGRVTGRQEHGNG